MPPSVRAATPSSLIAVAHVLGRLDVGLADRLDALHVDLVEVELGAEREARQNGELVRGVEAADVEGRIGFGIAELLRFLQHLGERAVLVGHRRQDEIAGAVEDAVDARHLIGGKRLAQRLDDRDAAGDRRFEVERDALLLGELGELDAVLCEQRLVGGDDVLARAERRLDRILGNAVGAADQLDEHIDAGIARERDRIVEPLDAGRVDARGPCPWRAPICRRARQAGRRARPKRALCVWSSSSRPAPTVPRPAMPRVRGFCMESLGVNGWLCAESGSRYASFPGPGRGTF